MSVHELSPQHKANAVAGLRVQLLIAFGLLMTVVVNAQSAWPIGEVQVQGTATITKASGGTVTITNGSYTWFPGDTITNGSGQSLLVMDDGTTLGLGEGAVATVSVAESGTSVVTMQQGSVLYTTVSGAEVQFMIGDVVMTTTSTQGSSGAVGLLQVGPDGTHRAEVVEGSLLASIETVSGPTVVEMTAGETYLVSHNAVANQALASVASATTSSSATTSAVASSTTSTLLGGFALAVTAASTYIIAFDDDETPVTEPPVSP